MKKQNNRFALFDVCHFRSITIGAAFFSLLLLAAACGQASKHEAQPTEFTSAVQSAPGQAPAPIATSASPSILAQPSSGKPVQFVVMAFDGSYSLNMWQNTLDFARSMSAEGHPVHFTYFVSGVYFLNWRKANRYLPPRFPPGTSLIGFADSNMDVEKRVANVNRAISEGHEIGSHANGHFDGAKWGLKDWQQELSQFDNLLFNIAENNDVSSPDVPRYTVDVQRKNLFGFRAPNLVNTNAMYGALKEYGYAYDTSGEGLSDQWPKKLPNGIWEFPITQIDYASTTAKIKSMDYNFYFKQSQAKDVARKGDAKWDKFFNDTYTSYINYFYKNYNGSRAPVYIGSHFSEWNDGVYWEAMKKFASEACSQPEVRCVSYQELMGYMNSSVR